MLRDSRGTVVEIGPHPGPLILDFAQVPADITPAMFTCARTAGWAAHIMEQKLTGRLIRPSAHYVGPAPRPVRDVPGAAEIIDRDA